MTPNRFIFDVNENARKIQWLSAEVVLAVQF